MSYDIYRIRKRVARLIIAVVVASMAASGAALASGDNGDKPESAAAANHAQPIEALVAEAMRASPLLTASRGHYQALNKVASQVSTLPDPEITLQQLTVGGPKPFEGYETSDFYYTGFGASQDIPWPGKLRLRGEQATHDALAGAEDYESARRTVAEKVRENAFELYFLAKRRDLLADTRERLTQIEKITEDQYRFGKAQNQDVIKAQLEMTSILKDIEMTRDDIAERQATLKSILGREPSSADIEIGDIQPQTFKMDRAQLKEIASDRAPDVLMARHLEAKSATELQMAKEDYIPDFSLSYMYQKTGPGMRDYYMLTLGAKVPLYFWRKQKPAIEQAVLEKQAAGDRMRQSMLDATAEAERNRVAIATQDRILTIYRDGLIPQSRATLESALAAYRTGQVDFQTLLSATLDVLNTAESYYRAMADREIAIARIKQIIGEQS